MAFVWYWGILSLFHSENRMYESIHINCGIDSILLKFVHASWVQFTIGASLQGLKEKN